MLLSLVMALMLLFLFKYNIKKSKMIKCKCSLVLVQLPLSVWYGVNGKWVILKLFEFFSKTVIHNPTQPNEEKLSVQFTGMLLRLMRFGTYYFIKWM